MQETITSEYIFRYTSKYYSKEKYVSLNWEITECCIQDLADNHRSEICNKTEDYRKYFDADSKFLIKLKRPENTIATDKASLQLFYLAPVAVCVHIKLTNYSGRLMYASKELEVIQPNIWLHIPISKVLSPVNISFSFKISTTYEVAYEMVLLQISNDLENLLNTSMFSDVTLKSTDAEEFKVHKAMLAARSDVLKAHFEHNMVESLSNVVEAPFPADVLRQVLTFIYTGDDTEVATMTEKLFKAADYYQINTLKKLCERELCSRITFENAIDNLELANLYSATELKGRVVEFIVEKKDNALNVIKTTSWENLQSIEIVKYMFERVLCQ